jgi:hypothetical protein
MGRLFKLALGGFVGCVSHSILAAVCAVNSLIRVGMG